MMRVVSGSAGGIALAAPKAGMRPTMDRVKSAMFSMLGERVPGARVLDLFSGSGALGIEALSRGAISAVFVENDRPTAGFIRKNLGKTRLAGEVREEDVFVALRSAAGRGEQYDLVFADPPYASKNGGASPGAVLLANPDLARVIAPAGLMVLEKASAEQLPDIPGWACCRRRRYGVAEVLILEVQEEGA